jgi:hypothetical protein
LTIFSPSDGSWSLSVEERFGSLLRSFTTGVVDSTFNSAGSVASVNEGLIEINNTSLCPDDGITYESFNNEQEHWNHESLRRSPETRSYGSLLFNPRKILLKAIDKVQQRRDSSRQLKIFTSSRATAFGRLDFIIQTKSLPSKLDTSPISSLHSDKLEGEFEASVIITLSKNMSQGCQMIFKLPQQMGFNSLLMPTLSFRSTLPNDSEVFKIVRGGSPHDLETLLDGGLASLSDCDTEGRSLFHVGITRLLLGTDANCS